MLSISGKKSSVAASTAGGSGGNSTPKNGSYSPSGFDIWMLGITIVIGGQYFSWNTGLEAGVHGYLISFLLVSLGYIILCCCTAEITSYLPFAGGAYGLCRCTLGFLPGFIIGACEAMEYIAYVATSVVFLADIMVAAFPQLQGSQPVIWFLFYITSAYINFRGNRVFWYFTWAIGIISLVILLIFCFGSLSFVDYPKNIPKHNLESFHNGFAGMVKSLPIAPWFYVGVEALSMASDQVPNPKRTIPKSQVICVLTLFVTGILVYFITVSLPPHDDVEDHLAKVLLPLNSGFIHMFPSLDDHYFAMMAIPATYATAFGFMWAYGRLISAMGNSKLLPPYLGQFTEELHTPAHALIAGSIVSYGLCLIVVFVPSAAEVLFNMCIMSGFMAYSGQMIGYIALKKKYFKTRHNDGAFHSPFGIPGAVVGLCIWLLALIGALGYQGRGFLDAGLFIALLSCVVIYYYRVAKKRQTLSLEENKVLLVAHIMKFNKGAANSRGSRKTNKVQADSSAKDESGRSQSISAPGGGAGKVQPHPQQSSQSQHQQSNGEDPTATTIASTAATPVAPTTQEPRTSIDGPSTALR